MKNTLDSTGTAGNGSPPKPPQRDLSPWAKLRVATHRRREDYMALSPEARDLYFALSCDQVTPDVGPAPANPRVLRAMFGHGYIDFPKAWKQVKPYTRTEGDRLYTRLGDEWAAERERDRAKAAEAGKASARARALVAGPNGAQRPLNGGQRPLDSVQPRASSGSGGSDLSTDPLPAAAASGEGELRFEPEPEPDRNGASTSTATQGKRRRGTAAKAEPGEHAQAVAAWCSTYAAEIGRPYPFRAGRDGDNVKAILAFPDYTLDEFRRLASAHLRDPYWTEKGRDLGTFKAQWPRLGNAGVPATNGSATPHREPTQEEIDRWALALAAAEGRPGSSAAQGDARRARQEIASTPLSEADVRSRAGRVVA